MTAVPRIVTQARDRVFFFVGPSNQEKTQVQLQQLLSKKKNLCPI